MVILRHFLSDNRSATHMLRCVCVVVILSIIVTPTARSQSVPHVEAQAPPDQAILSRTREGAYFVAKSLKQEYDGLLSRVQALQADLDAERIGGSAALHELSGLQAELKRLRAEIEKKKTLVPIAKLYRQSETTTFELGPAKLLVITADALRIEGWNGPHIKCVLEKTVISTDGAPVDGHLQSLKLVHRHATAPNLVGRTDQEREASEREFLAGPDGQKMNEQQRALWLQFSRQTSERFEPFRVFQGNQIDTVEIEGLTYEQGNRSIVLDFRSAGGQSSSSSHWQRSAALTVYVPVCKALALRGCLESLSVQGVEAALLVTSEGSRDRDYNGHFQIRNLRGSLTAENIPLDLVDAIQGRVSIRSNVEFANTETRHANDTVTIYTPPPRVLTCRSVAGDFTGWFTRADLKLDSIGGRIDVTNECGDTTLEVDQALTEKPHRVISESGKIELHITPKAVRRSALLALSNCGTIRTNISQDVLRDTNFTLGYDPTGRNRDWHGLTSIAERAAEFDRVLAALADKDRPAGLDLISRCGPIRLLSEAKSAPQGGPATSSGG